MEPLTVPGTLDSLETIRKYVTAAAAMAGLDKKTIYGLCLAVDEIATNIITHGYAEAGRQGNLDMRVDLDKKALTIYLEDTGIVYDPQPNPDDLDLPLVERSIGGLGIYIARQNVDTLRYESIGERNRHTFIVNRVPTSEEG